MQSSLFVRDPWTIIRDAVQRDCRQTSRGEAIACLEQARDFYSSASTASIAAARPLQLYYCFLNLAKAFALTSNVAPTFDRAQHGLSERLAPGGKELADAFLAISPASDQPTRQIFAEFYASIAGTTLPATLTSITVPALLPQILPGHRLWAAAANRVERFISLHEARLYHDPVARTVWVSLLFYRDDLSRLGVGHASLLEQARLQGRFRQVHSAETSQGRSLICYEQTAPVAYATRPSDVAPALVGSLRTDLWTVVGTAPPYRRYYVYTTPTAEHPVVMPQLLGIYAVTYYLGSITRYRPQHFDAILTGRFGSFVEEFLASQPTQYIYLMASQFAKRDVTQPAIV